MEKQQKRTWSEIKLRNLSDEVQTALNDIMAHYDEATASKVLERIILSHMEGIRQERSLKETVSSLNREITILKSDLRSREKDIADIKESYSKFISLISK